MPELIHPFQQTEPRPGQIGKIVLPGYSHLRFEWHPEHRPNPDTVKGTAFVVRIGVLADGAEMAEPFAWGVKDSASFINEVHVWMRGYKHAMLELQTGSIAEHKEKSDYVDL